jgi:RNA polymerase sigma-70 factor, ECF subfamily
VELPPKGPEPDDEVGETEEPEETAAQAGFLGARDVEAFKQLFDTHYERLYRYALRYLRSAEEANDVVHDVFLQMWRHRQRIGLGRDLRAYLYTTTRNHALDRLKRRKVEDSFRERSDMAVAQEGSDAESELESRELAATIQRAMDSLPPRQREVLRMRWQQHLSYEEIAKALNISPKTVAIHLSRGLQHLREALPDIAE